MQAGVPEIEELSYIVLSYRLSYICYTPMKQLFLFALLLPLVLLFTACGDDDGAEETPRPVENILEVVQATDGLDSLAQLITLLGPEFSSQITSSEYTVFAPNNAAFANLLNTIGLRSMLDLRNSLLIDIITYHLIPNTSLQSTQLDSSLTAFNQSVITLTTDGDSVRVNPTTQPTRTVVVSADLLASNGVVHVIDGVLLSPGIARNLAPLFGTLAGLTSTYTLRIGQPGDGDLSTINSVFNQTGLLTNLGSNTSTYTVLAPLDATFDNFFFTSQQNVADVAGYHVLPGNVDLTTVGRTISTINEKVLYVTNDEGNISLNGTPVFDLGYTASNGKLLVALGVLKPAAPLPEIVTYADNLSGNTFTIFKTALEQTGINLGTNKTIFMPTDSAFQRAGLVTSIDSAARIDPSVLANVLQTHVVEGITFSSDIVAAGTVEALAANSTPLTASVMGEGQNASVVVRDSNAETEDATLLIAVSDLLSDNGVVHVIDELLLPE